MNQKLIKSPTEANLSIPIRKNLKHFQDHNEYASVPLSKESPSDRVPVNTPKRYTAKTGGDKLLSKKLANLLDPNPTKHNKTADPTEHLKSPAKSPANKVKKLLKSNLTKIFGTNTTQDIDPVRSKELAKLALSKIMAKEMLKKKAVEPKATTLPKTASTAHLRPATHDPVKTGTPQKDLRVKRKPPQISVGYNDSAVIENTRYNKHSAALSPQSILNAHSPNNKSMVNLMPQTTTNASIHYHPLPGKQTIVPLHTPKSSLATSTNRDGSNPRGKFAKQKKQNNSANVAPFGREFIQFSSGNLPKPTALKHKRVGSDTLIDQGHSSSIVHQSTNHSNVASKKNINYSCIDKINQYSEKFLTDLPSTEPAERKPKPILRKTLDPGHYALLKNAFATLIENYQYDLSSSANNFQLLKNLKNSYEQYIDTLLNSIPDIGSVQTEHDDLKRDFIKTMQEKIELKEDLEKAKQENAKLQKFIVNMKKDRTSVKSQLSTEKRAYSESPDTEFRSKLSLEKESLSKIVDKQTRTIAALKQKETKLISLVMAIKKKGVDVEKIYAEEIRHQIPDIPEEDIEFSSAHTRSKKGKDFLQDSEGHDEIPTPQSEESPQLIDASPMVTTKATRTDKGSSDMKKGKGSDAKSSISNALTAVSTGVRQFSGNPNIKSKLRLDLTSLGKPEKNQGPESADPYLGFHDEFMSKIGEFSLSWRQAAMGEKKF